MVSRMNRCDEPECGGVFLVVVLRMACGMTAAACSNHYNGWHRRSRYGKSVTQFVRCTRQTLRRQPDVPVDGKGVAEIPQTPMSVEETQQVLIVPAHENGRQRASLSESGSTASDELPHEAHGDPSDIGQRGRMPPLSVVPRRRELLQGQRFTMYPRITLGGTHPCSTID